ncbi:BglG family transcription antiterminator [Paenibacillus physcomitrellae]|uniref:Transcriptional regulator MtlR n=1 Tax=Paenibacillus physcomitrellae TaxID=1619311 RepID=A0ABQ1G8W9_9BACL|nr:BglG family transcription antiterminator [Paenibacillus physcomitrellae]GGA39002.1 transcriptional regulator MtlR [Paenibacillus physcomitrellae]
MNQLTARQRQILTFLLDRKEETTAAEIAEEARVSVRTVHREMEGLEQFLADFDLHLKKKSGKGIELEGTQASMDKLAAMLKEEKPSEYTVEERKIYILTSLLQADEPVKLFTLAHALKVTVPTVTNDLNELELWIKRFRLELIRRRGYGVEIEGREEDKRRAICQLAEENLDPSDLVGASENYPPLLQKLLNLAGKDYFMFVESALWNRGSKWLDELSEKAYTHLLISLSVAVSRILQDKKVEDNNDGSAFYGFRPRNLDDAQDIVAELSEVLDIPFCSFETNYIALMLDALQDSAASEYLTQADLLHMEIVQQLIRSVAEKTGYPLQGDKSLREGLLQHIDPALKRLQEGSRIRNPLLASIRKDYEPLFQTVKEAVSDLDSALGVPDEEIGFLVMHFGASIERLKRLQQDVRAILVCSSGIGSAKLLATRLAKEIPQIEIVRNSSWYEAARIPEEDYDLIISTIDLPLPQNRYIRLSPLLTREDIERLIDYIKNTTFKQMDAGRKAGGREDRSEENSSWAVGRIKSLHTTLTEILVLIEQFRLGTIDTTGRDLHYALLEACRALAEDSILDDPDKVTNLLLERELLGSLIIPDSSLALFHTRSAHILQPSLSLYRLSQPVRMDGETNIQVMLIMLGPRELPKESLEILSEISALLLWPDLIRLMEQGSEQDIKQFLATELMGFFKNKV